MKYIILLLLFSGSLFASAQSRIAGKVFDEQSGEPLIGATVSAGGVSATTNSKGQFALVSSSKPDTIEVSFLGYEKRRISVSGDGRFISIELHRASISLSDVTVTGYDNNRRLLEVAGSIGVLDSKQLQRGDQMDIMPALNSIPGVKMEAYSAGNYRISIRGSLVNNPWGIRNVRIYWNDIPLSSPDGTAQKSIDLDPKLIGSVEVLKGPSGSMYGAGNGGVLLIKNSRAAVGENSLETGYTAGSYGFGRLQTSYRTAGENFNISANIVSQRYDGYRENNWGNKDVQNVFAQIFPSERRTLSFFATHSAGSLGIAGGLNEMQVNSNPRQAVQYNLDNKISVKKYNATALGAAQHYQLGGLFSNTTSVYGNFQTYDHPFGSSIYYNGYLKESLSGYGGRTKFVYTPTFGTVKARFSFGGEYQYQHQFGNTFGIVNDQAGTWPEPGAIRQNDIVKSTSTIIFAQGELDLPWKTYLTVGASYTGLSYDILDLLTAAGHANYSGLLKFPVKASPRIGLVKVINDDLAVHGSMSYGYSPPPVWEINNYDGTLNKDIKPEDGVNYEIGTRGSFFAGKVNFDLTAYQMYLKNAIVPVARPDGTTSYKNAGKTDQKGFEAMLSYQPINDKSKQVSLLKAWLSYTYNDYTFVDYQTQSFDYASSSVVTIDNSGKMVTGVVPNSLAAGIDIETRLGVYLNTIYYRYDSIPLNDANTYYSNAYSLLNLKLGYKVAVGKFGLDLSAGVNNLTDSSYSSLLLYNADANGIPAQFYNPSVDINFYGGLSLKYNFSK